MDAADPAGLVTAAIERLDPSHLSGFVVAAGKAAARMYAAAAPLVRSRAVVVTAPLSGRPPANVEYFGGGHPAPNAESVRAAERALRLAHASAAHEGLLVLLSGGASAMLAAPAAGLTIQDKVATADRLMAAGAAIHDLNCVRKHLSRVKGGRLAAAARRTVTLALSDVHGPIPDDPSVIASGPTVPDETTFEDALSVIRSRSVSAPPAVIAHLQRGAQGEVEETVKPGDPRIVASEYVVIGNRETAAAGARRAAAARGYHVVVLPGATSGEARDAGRSFVEDALRRRAAVPPPLCVIGTGETTVTVRGDGRGGRNQEFVLAAASGLSPSPRASGSAQAAQAVIGSVGTDGIDGPTDAAGAIADGTTLARGLAAGLSSDSALGRNDAYTFFDGLGDLVRWGPTGTNVGDLHVLLIG